MPSNLCNLFSGHPKIPGPEMKIKGAQFSNELQLKRGHQDSNPSSGRQIGMPYSKSAWEMMNSRT